MTTWKDIKLATLQKMFSSNGTTIQVDSSTQEYILSMPQAANEGLQLLSTAGKFIIKPWTVNNFPCPNLLGEGYQNIRYTANTSVKAKNAHSYYFEIMGTDIRCTLTVEGSDPIIIHSPDETKIVSPTGYSVFKGRIENEDKEVTISFECDYPYNVRNICMYAEKFATDEDIPAFQEYLKFNLKELIPDFYQLSETDIYLEQNGEPSYLAASNYYQEADKALIIPRKDTGVYTVYYKAYPGEITLSTPDTYDMSLDPEVAAILPLYMASQLYKDDDNAIATVYRNEFEVAREALSQKANVSKREEFISESGW
jgi:hypothetical protein